MAPRTLLLLLGAAFLPSFYHLVGAEDEAAEANDDVLDDMLDGFGDGEEDGGEPASFGESAKELQDKLGLLKEMLEQKGEGVDPDLKQRLSGLQEQLGKLGLGADDLGIGSGAGPPAARDPTEVLAGCVALSMRKAGVKKESTMTALKKLADGLTKEEGGKVELVRMVAVCSEDVTDVDLYAFHSGSLLELPRAMYNKAITSDGRKSVLGTSDDTWKELAAVAKSMIKELAAEQNPVKKAAPGSSMGLFALVPIIGAVGFMIKRLLDMQKENDKKSNSGKKDKKKKQ